MIIDEIEGALEPEEGEVNEDSFGFTDEHGKIEDAGDVDHTDLLKLYLREASRSSMLTAEGEIAAAKRIERARLRLMKLLSRSLVVAEYCLHLRQTIGRGVESPADVIETVSTGGNAASSLPVSELADPALARIEFTYRDLFTQKVASVRQISRRKRVNQTAHLRRQAVLYHSIRSITFTPAAER